ncbi:MAG: gamma-glutamyl-gamma-aminobutyrate hydrolase family protein, partial [Frankiaceae bacterium]|nr:gamma-glutamyl-gamma-aminobutyrate hydrolase family protein [Arenimonas sp.]
MALGGTLHQKVHDVDGLHDHREDEAADLDVQYGPGHPVALRGTLARIAGSDTALV